MFEDHINENGTTANTNKEKIEENPSNIKQNETAKEDTYDLQKELEAKFDELFGPIDE